MVDLEKNETDCPASRSKINLFLKIAVFLLVLLVLLLGSIPRKRETLPEKQEKYSWKGCGNLGKCKLKGFETPPLIILSLDGFAREYLDRNLVKSLNYIAECGAKAEHVYPSFPSKTFSNHYSIVTGLYPESHGITDNIVYDEDLSDDLVKLKETKDPRFFGGEPIWSVYKRVTGKRAHCFNWVGCSHNSTGYMPDEQIADFRNQNLRTSIDKVLEWLLLPADKRPGLINFYYNQPDDVGHHQNSSADIDKELVRIDEDLDYLMSRLKEANLLECVNFAIVSDHGMQKLNRTLYFVDYIRNFDGLLGAKGVVGRIYIKDKNRSEEEVVDQIRCKIPKVKVFTKKDIPVRRHYSTGKRVGDLMIEGPPGTEFYKAPADYIDNTGDHGYDYYNEKMHTMFFMRGPSIKANVTIPPFQNVQYMNLWMKLLGIEGTIDTNGTIGFFDDILINPPKRAMLKNNIKECVPLKKTKSALPNCASSRVELPIFSDHHCFENFCEDSIIRRIDQRDKSVAIVEVLSRNETVTTKAGRIADSMFKFPANFTSKVLQPLQLLTQSHLDKFGKLYVVSGIAFDLNHDGLSDIQVDEESEPTHFYRIIITCEPPIHHWRAAHPPPSCHQTKQMKSLAFIFPIIAGKSAMDCMTADEILTEYSATILDVEKIAGFKFQFNQMTYQENVMIRNKIGSKL